MKTVSILIILCTALFSCRSPQQLADRKCAKAQAKYEKSAYRYGCPLVMQTDTVYREITIRETHDTTIVVYIAADTVRDSITVVIKDGLVNSDMSRLDTQYAWATAKVINSVLVLRLYQREAEIEKTIKDAIQKDSRVEYQTITRTLTQKTNYLTQWQIAQLWMGRLLMAMLVLLLGVTLFKLYFKK